MQRWQGKTTGAVGDNAVILIVTCEDKVIQYKQQLDAGEWPVPAGLWDEHSVLVSLFSICWGDHTHFSIQASPLSVRVHQSWSQSLSLIPLLPLNVNKQEANETTQTNGATVKVDPNAAALDS